MVSDEQLSPIGESSVPVPNRMLRRLKRATSISDLCPRSETLDSVEADGEEDLVKPGLQSAKGFEGLSVGDGVTARKALDFDSVPEFNPAIGGLGEKGDEEISDSETREEIRVSETKESGKEPPGLDTSVPELDSALEEFGEKGEDEICDLEIGEEIKVSELKEAGKKRPVLETSDGEGKENKRNKKRKKKSVDFDELPISTASMNMTKKVTLFLLVVSS